MTERGGRLSADIQAVMASDYVRNLRQEIIKGIYGRLKNGIYPFKAPVGYIDKGKGKLKEIDLIQSKLVYEAFLLYSTGFYSVKKLARIMKKKGLLNGTKNGVTTNNLTRVLRNPFYTGVMKVKGQIFEGKHEAIISSDLFRKVNHLMDVRTTSSGLKHSYLFKRKVCCGLCKKTMSGELQKGQVYYRCHTKDCITKCCREDNIDFYLKKTLSLASLEKDEILKLENILFEEKQDLFNLIEKQKRTYNLKLSNLKKRHDRIQESYIDETFTKEEYVRLKNTTNEEISKINKQLVQLEGENHNFYLEFQEFFELYKSPINIYQNADLKHKRIFIEITTSNFVVYEKKVEVITNSIFQTLQLRGYLDLSALKQDSHRTLLPKVIFSDKNMSLLKLKLESKEQARLFLEVLKEEWLNYKVKNGESILNTIKNIDDAYEL
tara:strand:- start:295 stop:1602 length:1308 start_codon:yes stop_codon:yes gene_type:complete